MNEQVFRSISYVKRNYKFIIPLILILSLFLGYSIGYSRSTKKHYFNTLTQAIEKKDVRRLSKLIMFDGKVDDLKPLLRYLEIGDNKDDFINSLKKAEIYNGFSLVAYKDIFFKKYKLKVEPIEIFIKTNYPSEIYIDDMKLGTTKENEELSLIKPVMGLYSIEAKVVNEFGEIKDFKEIAVFNEDIISLDIKGTSVSINSPYEDGEVYINDKYINRKVKEVKDFSFFSNDEINKLYYTYDFPWGTVKSEELSIGKYPEVSPKINLVNDQLKDDIDKTIKDFYKSVFDSLNKENMNLIKNITEDVRFSIYSDLTKNYFLLKNIYNLNDIEVNIEEESFKYDGIKYSGNIKVKLKYAINKNLIGISIGEEKEEKTFITTCEYINSKWNVTGINKN